MNVDYEKILNMSSRAILIVNNHKILFANKAAFEIFGYTDIQELQKDIKLCNQLNNCHNERIVKYICSNRDVEAIQKTENIDFDGNPAICFYIDKIQEDEINRPELQIIKSRFMAAVSHEMRTPLNSIVNLAQLLRQSDLDEKQNELVELANDSAIELLQRVEDVLEYSQISSHNFKPDFEKMNLLETTRSIVDPFRKKAKEKQIKFITNISPDADNNFNGEPELWQRIVYHLCDNAVKYTNNGIIQINLTLSDDNQGIIFEIKDTGEGIKADLIEKIFNPFRYDELAPNGSYYNLSLGLALCKKIARSMGGDINIENNYPKGTIASVYLPFDLIDEEDIDVDIPLNILIAEDNPTNQKVICMILKQFGHNADTADNGKICLDKIKSKNYDLILMDLHMPIMNGFEAAVNIRKTGSQIPIYAVTADNREETRINAKKTGMNGFLTKPLAIARLYQILYEVALNKQIKMAA